MEEFHPSLTPNLLHYLYHLPSLPTQLPHHPLLLLLFIYHSRCATLPLNHLTPLLHSHSYLPLHHRHHHHHLNDVLLLHYHLPLADHSIQWLTILIELESVTLLSSPLQWLLIMNCSYYHFLVTSFFVNWRIQQLHQVLRCTYWWSHCYSFVGYLTYHLVSLELSWWCLMGF
jgi:hypothetical protein